METLNQYLSRKGLFDDATPEKIKESKKEYRRLYKLDHLKEYRRNHTRTEIYFKKQDYAFIQKYASAHNMKTPRYIKESVLAYTKQAFLLPEESLVRDLQMEIRKIGGNINQLVRYVHRNRLIVKEDITLLRQHLIHMEQKITTALRQPPNVETYLDKEIQQHPELLDIIRNIIKKHE